MADPTTHGAPLAPGPGSLTCLIGGMPAWRALIDMHACPAVSITGPDGVGMVMMGSPTVLIDFMMACRMGDIVVEIPGLAMGPANPIVMGCPTVLIGEVGMGGGAPGGAAMPAMGAALGGPVGTAATSLAQASRDGVALLPVAGALGAAIGTGAGPGGGGGGADGGAGGDGSGGADGQNAGADGGPGSKKVWVEIQLVDQFGKPVPNEPYSITLPDGTTSEGSTDDSGMARVDGIDPGNCKISFTSIDKRSWKKT
jgi:hypothetical protein